MSLPWFPMNRADFIVATMAYSAKDMGAFILLICHYWQFGGVPGTDAERADIAGVSLEEWPAIASLLTHRTTIDRPLFTPEWINPYMDAVRAKCEANYERAATRLRALCDRRPNAEQWMTIRSRIFERDGYICTYCGAGPGGNLECDHIHPVCRGGSSEDDNLTTACFACNRSKGTQTIEEWSGLQ